MLRLFSNVLSATSKIPGQISSLRSSLLDGQSTTKILPTPQPLFSDQLRTVTKFSYHGKRKTVQAVLLRFFRLHWGAWIRTKAGRHKKMWARTPVRRRQRREHVFCTATQSMMLDRMVSNFWRKPKFYIDDPYTPYHTREEFYITRKKPWRPEGWE